MSFRKNIKKVKRLLKKIGSFIREYYLQILQKKIIAKELYINDIKSHFSSNLDDINYQTLIPSFTIEFTDSEKKFLEEPLNCSRVIQNSKTTGFFQREVFLCAFKNIKFFGHSGGLSYNNLPILESACTRARFYRYVRNVDSIFLKHKKMKGTYVSIMHLYKGNFYHWLIESIPRLYGISRITESEINFIIPKWMPEWQLEILDSFLDEKFKLISIDRNEVWDLEKFYFLSFFHIDCSAFIPKPMIDFVRSKIIGSYNIEKRMIKKRIYISRNKMTRRRIKNENELLKLLKKYNFELVHPQDLNFKKQVEMFKNAEIIIGVTGAGFSNILFSENLKLIIIYPPNLITTHYMLLSKSCGFTFRYIIGDDLDENYDISVDLNKTEKIIIDLIEY